MNKAPTDKGRTFAAFICFAGSAYLLAAAFGLVRPDDGQVHTPLWVVGLCGIAFGTAGCMVLIGQQARINDLLASILTLAFSLVGIWLAVFSSPVFALGSVTTLAISIWAFKRYLDGASDSAERTDD